MAQNRFATRRMAENPLEKLLENQEKIRKAEERAKASQSKADQSIILNKVPSKVWVDPKTGKHMMQGNDGTEVEIDIDRYNIEQARNQEIQQAYNRTYKRPAGEKQNYPPAPKSQVATKKTKKVVDTYADGKPKLNTLDKVKLMPEMLRQGLSSYMSGNRGGQVVGQPNIPSDLTMALMKSGGMRGAETPQFSDLNLPPAKLPFDLRKKRDTTKEDRNLEFQIAKHKFKKGAEGAKDRVVQHFADASKKTSQRWADARDEIKRDTYALWQQTPSLKDLTTNYASGVKGRVRQLADFATKNLFPQARTIEYANPAKKKKQPVKRRYTKYGTGDSPE